MTTTDSRLLAAGVPKSAIDRLNPELDGKLVGNEDTYQFDKKPLRFSPWTFSQRPGGDWVVKQVDRVTGKISGFGPFDTEDEARTLKEMLEDGNA